MVHRPPSLPSLVPAIPAPRRPLLRLPTRPSPVSNSPPPPKPRPPARPPRRHVPLPSTNSTQPAAPPRRVGVSYEGRPGGGAAHVVTPYCAGKPPRGCGATAALPAPPRPRPRRLARLPPTRMHLSDSDRPRRLLRRRRPAPPRAPSSISTPVPPATSPSHSLALRLRAPSLTKKGALTPCTSSILLVVLIFAVVDAAVGILVDACPAHPPHIHAAPPPSALPRFKTHPPPAPTLPLLPPPNLSPTPAEYPASPPGP